MRGRLRTKLSEALFRGKGLPEVSRELRTVGERKLREIAADRWHSLKREQIEEICNHFDLDIVDLFELSSGHFWEPIEKEKRALVLSEIATGQRMPRDHEAVSLVSSFLYNEFDVKAELLCPATASEFARLSSHSIITVGLKHNLSSLIAFCRISGIEPFVGAPMNREKLVVQLLRDGFQSNILVKPPLEENNRRVGGIELAGELVVEAEIFSQDTFYATEIPDGTDGGFIAVSNNAVETRKQKTIVVVGLSRLGTLGAAEILTTQYHELDPPPDHFLVAVVEVKYTKKAHKQAREKQSAYLKTKRILPSP